MIDRETRQNFEKRFNYSEMRSALENVFPDSAISSHLSRFSTDNVKDSTPGFPKYVPLRVYQSLDSKASTNEKPVDQQQISITSSGITPEIINWNPLLKIAFFISLAIFLLTMCINLFKPAFLSLGSSIGFCSWWLLRSNFKKVLSPLVFIFTFFFTFITDLIFVTIYSKPKFMVGLDPNQLFMLKIEKFCVRATLVNMGLEMIEVLVLLVVMLQGLYVGNSIAKFSSHQMFYDMSILDQVKE